MDINDLLNNVLLNNEDDKKTSTNSNKQNKKFSNFDIDDENIGKINIKILGIGGAGNNIISFLNKPKVNFSNVELWALNTDIKPLKKIKSEYDNINCILIGKNMLNGIGAGGEAEVAKNAIQENINEIKENLNDTDIVFLIAGLGKGTGSGVTPEIAKMCKELGINVISFLVLPSIETEGKYIYSQALEAKEKIELYSDSLCLISNDKLLCNRKINNNDMFKCFEDGNNEFKKLFLDFYDLISSNGEINIDYNDIRNFFKRNKYVNHYTIKINNNPTFDELKKNINSIIDNSIFVNEHSVNNLEILINFKIHSETEKNIIEYVKKIIDKNNIKNNIKFLYGIENVTLNPSINIFISCDSTKIILNTTEEIDNYEEFSNLFKKTEKNEKEKLDFKTEEW